MKTNRKKIQRQKYTTSKICTAKQLIFKGEIQTLIKILTERERPNEHEINNKRLRNKKKA